MTGGTGGPFPARTTATATVRVDSIAEQGAYLAAYPSPDGPWHVAGQLLVGASAPTDHVRLRSPAGEEAVVRFDVSSFFGGPGLERGGGPAAELVDRLSRRAQDFARENGLGHPGELPRFPVPSARYPGRVEVPLAILALDDAARRGLYAPARAVVLDWPGGEPVGVGELPGFDPERWPPPRLGDWPPDGLRGIAPDRLRGIVARFGGCWGRLLDAFLTDEKYPQRRDEAAEARALLGMLEPPAMAGVYEELSPRFWASLAG